jgi:UDP-N-acetylglucosamine 4,6-dehydratase
LITGGTGSFGRTMVKKLLDLDALKVRVLSRDETKQYQLQMEFGSKNFETILGDVRDEATVASALKNIDFVFHAAALKQVPFSEENPMEYVKTNVLGSHNLLTSLVRSQVKNAVFLSTDKAVYPINAMGMTKSLMEKLVRSSSYTGNSINCITRYGNVIGSRGSIIPYLINQIKQNLPVKITDWDMTRFMMSLEESVDLVLHAMSHGNSGDLFVKKSPSADLRTILTSVENLVGKKAGKVEIQGCRPGEKMHETILNSEEWSNALEIKDFFQVKSITGINAKINSGKRSNNEFTSDNTNKLSIDQLSTMLSQNSELKKLL